MRTDEEFVLGSSDGDGRLAGDWRRVVGDHGRGWWDGISDCEILGICV